MRGGEGGRSGSGARAVTTAKGTKLAAMAAKVGPQPILGPKVFTTRPTNMPARASAFRAPTATPRSSGRSTSTV